MNPFDRCAPSSSNQSTSSWSKEVNNNNNRVSSNNINKWTSDKLDDGPVNPFDRRRARSDPSTSSASHLQENKPQQQQTKAVVSNLMRQSVVTARKNLIAKEDIISNPRLHYQTTTKNKADSCDESETGNNSNANEEWMCEYDYKQHKAEISRINYLLSEEGLDPSDPNEWAIIKCFYSVKAKTFNEYSSHYRNLRRQNLPISYAGALQLAEIHDSNQAVRVQGTYGQMSSAVRLYRIAYGEEGEKLQYETAVKGLTNCDKSNIRNVRGGITAAMVKSLLTLPEKTIPRTFKDYFILLQATGMRGNQLGRQRVDHIFYDKDKRSWYFVCPGNNKGRGNTERGQFEIHEPLSTWNEELERIIKKAKATGQEYLAPTWSATQGNIFIKLAAKTLKWNKKLMWVVHSLRHGAAIDCFECGDGDLMAKMLRVQQVTAHKGARMILQYAQANSQRGVVNQAGQELRAVLGRGGQNRQAAEIAMNEFGIRKEATERRADISVALAAQRNAAEKKIKGTLEGVRKKK